MSEVTARLSVWPSTAPLEAAPPGRLDHTAARSGEVITVVTCAGCDTWQPAGDPCQQCIADIEEMCGLSTVAMSGGPS